jgi:transcriptional regulator with XRE-family HTH domain
MRHKEHSKPQTGLGKRIRRLRADMTIEQFSKRTGVATASISQLETGAARNIWATTLFKIARACDVSASWLLFGRKEEPNEDLKIDRFLKVAAFLKQHKEHLRQRREVLRHLTRILDKDYALAEALVREFVGEPKRETSELVKRIVKHQGRDKRE